MSSSVRNPSFLNLRMLCFPKNFEHTACFGNIGLGPTLFLAFPTLRPILVEILDELQRVFFLTPETSHVVFGLEIMDICAIIENSVKNAGLHQQYDIRRIISALTPELIPAQFQDECNCCSCLQSMQEHKLQTLMCPVCAKMICEECYTKWKQRICPSCRNESLYKPQLPLRNVLHLWGEIIFSLIFGKNVKQFPSVLDRTTQKEIFSKIVSFMSEHLGIQIEVPSDDSYGFDFSNEDGTVVEVICELPAEAPNYCRSFFQNESEKLTSPLLSLRCETHFQCVIYANDCGVAGAAGAAGSAENSSANAADDSSVWYD